MAETIPPAFWQALRDAGLIPDTAPGADLMRVDSHHHVWSVARGDYGWLRPDSPICRDYGIADLRPLLGDIAATMLVQAAPTEAETRFLLEAARGSAGLVRGVVGWVDRCERPDARRGPGGRIPPAEGLRPMLQDLAGPGWILRPTCSRRWRRWRRTASSSTRWSRLAHLPAVRRGRRRHPQLRVVIDHGAKPEIAAGRLEPWAGEVAALARHANVACKLSGLVTGGRAGLAGRRSAPLRRRICRRVFGPERLMWGSDWPVVDLAGGYARWREASLALLRDLRGSALDRVLGGTAAEVYGL